MLRRDALFHQQASCREGDHAANRIADEVQLRVPCRALAAGGFAEAKQADGRIGHLPGPKIEAVQNCARLVGLVRQPGAGFVAGAKTKQIDGNHIGLGRQGWHGVAPMAHRGAKAMDQQHLDGIGRITATLNIDPVTLPNPGQQSWGY